MNEKDALEILWNYLNLQTYDGSHCDAMIVLGSEDVRIARYAGKLQLEHNFPVVIMSGKLNHYTKTVFHNTEAESFRDEALKLGIPASKILTETNSTNTQENLEQSLKLIPSAKKILLLQKPNMLRRVLATAKRLFPGHEFMTSTHPISFSDGPHAYLSYEYFAHEITGDFQRIMLYAERCLIVPQKYGPVHLEAYQFLVGRGFTKNLAV